MDYILYFNGNPNKMTIYGESAGAVSVGYLLESNLMTGWNPFQMAIMFSGPYIFILLSI